jgi:hypothetical protein
VNKRKKPELPPPPAEADSLAMLMEESAAAYDRAWLAFQKCKSDLSKANRCMKSAQKRRFGQLPHEHFEHYWGAENSVSRAADIVLTRSGAVRTRRPNVHAADDRSI